MFFRFLLIFLIAISNLFSNTNNELSLDSASHKVMRFYTRLDKQHSLKFVGLGGNTSYKNDSLNYYGGHILYDSLIGAYPLGGSISYIFQDSNTHNTNIAIYTDSFIGPQNLKGKISFGLDSGNKKINAPLALILNADGAYSYNFVLNSYGSFIAPLAGLNFYFIYNTKNSFASKYSINLNFDLGFNYTQFITKYFKFYIEPKFRQDILSWFNNKNLGDPFLKAVRIDSNGNVEFSLPSLYYRSYGILKAGMEFKIAKNANLNLGFFGLIAKNVHNLGGNASINILF